MSVGGLYVITDPALSAGGVVPAVERALAGGARVVQYRQKNRKAASYTDEALALRQLTLRHRATLIINDDFELAREAGADGVHIGADDGNVQQARAALGAGRIIGVSCYNALERALRAEAEGADYVAFGSFFPSTQKPDAVRVDLETLTEARAVLTVPIVAIGGISPANAKTLIAAGADSVAVISAVFGQRDVEAAARKLAALFD